MKLQRLSEPATINKYVQAVALPSSSAPSDTMCRVSGWGNTMSSVSGGMFPYLFCVAHRSKCPGHRIDPPLTNSNLKKTFQQTASFGHTNFDRFRLLLEKILVLT